MALRRRPIPRRRSSGTSPPAVLHTHPALLAHVMDHALDCALVAPLQRGVLGAVLPRFRDHGHLARIGRLPPELLAQLADLLLDALHLVRNKGGVPAGVRPQSRSSRSRSQQQSPSTSAVSLPWHALAAASPTALAFPVESSFEAPAPAAPAPAPNPTPREICLRAIGTVYIALGLDDLVPCGGDETSDATRKAKQRADCNVRHDHKCLLTLTEGSGVECVHILPHLVAAVETGENSLFWFLITLVFGRGLRDALFAAAGGSNAHAASNAILLHGGWHSMWDDGYFWFRPVPDDAYPTRQNHFYDLEIRIMTRPGYLNIPTQLPLDPAAQVVPCRTQGTAWSNLVARGPPPHH